MINLHHKIFPLLILIARPASGKSEIIDFLKKTPEDDRRKLFHIGKLIIIDDFPFLWRWFEEDEILTKMCKPRLYTDNEGYFKFQYLWDLLIEMINLEYQKFIRDRNNPDEYSVIIEFSRGKEHGGYIQALPRLSKNILTNGSLVYIDVTWEESLRKNRTRFNPEFPDSILEHGLPDKKLRKLYYECDFNEIGINSSGKIDIGKYHLPFVKINNNDDLTSNPGEKLTERLSKNLNLLWHLRMDTNGME